MRAQAPWHCVPKHEVSGFELISQPLQLKGSRVVKVTSFFHSLLDCRFSLLLSDQHLSSAWMQLGLITAENSRPFICYLQPSHRSVSRVSSGAAVNSVRGLPFERRKNGVRTLLCRVISYKALAHPSKHNGAVVSVLGLAMTGIDLALLSSSVSVWEDGQYLQALISLWPPLSLNWFSNVIAEKAGDVWYD